MVAAHSVGPLKHYRAGLPLEGHAPAKGGDDASVPGAAAVPSRPGTSASRHSPRPGHQLSNDAPPLPQVEGCGADLTDLRYFFRKQRICEQHARADVVTDAAGRQLRFCQQCTRLEPLLNFSTGRRSCKASLAKRQARAHRGKGDSSPDSSPERGAGPRRKAPHKGDHRSSSSEGGGSGGSGSGSGSGSGKLSSRRSGGLSHSSKRSRGESPSRGATPLGSGSPVHVMHATAAASSHAALPSNGSSMVASPQQLAAMQLAAAQHQQAALAAAAAQQQEQQQRAAQAAAAAQQQQQAAAAGDMLWSGSLVENDLEELLAMDPGGCVHAWVKTLETWLFIWMGHVMVCGVARHSPGGGTSCSARWRACRLPAACC